MVSPGEARVKFRVRAVQQTTRGKGFAGAMDDLIHQKYL